MHRTTVSLPDDLSQALTREARRRSVSASEIAREALATHLGFDSTVPRALPFAALGDSGQHSTARDMEKLLGQEWDDHTGNR